ncbi:DUF2889 domain-containing protein [Nitrincola tapanii]|jgi:hypothetical protein|uniref:DUF2889 domain-containing protein n=1 Tax=Nitrincola tapanii TaxID=1708751 RepID=A0A5A9W7W1_9GAMM|nr:DUF2889 domain-containing protein [Nitrincola tapanii]KAA0876564.1 DUF2889 domain-containing protein [Nitrincola tapanii]
MPLSKPVRRRTLHTRQTLSHAFQREDGLWDIEARMTDVKTDPVNNPERGGFVAAGETFHDISMRLTIDREMKIHAVEAVMDSTPFKMCPRIAERYRLLEGTRIGPGWLRQAAELTGSIQGCTHLNDLLRPLATTAFQALWPNEGVDNMDVGSQGVINTCHTWAQNSPAVKLYQPQYYSEQPPAVRGKGREEG